MELKKLIIQTKLFEKAYLSLKQWLEKENLSDLEQDWIIQRFEYTIEIAWKTLKKFLQYKKVSFLATPKDIFRECYRLWLIDDLDLWEDLLDIRNISSHTYSEYLSNKSFEVIKKNYTVIGTVIEKLKNIGEDK